MPVALDSTIGGASANTYVTRAEAQAYVAQRGFPASERDPFLGLSVADQDLVLLQVMEALEQLPWVGERATPAQALEWPRYGAYKKDRSTLFLITELPEPVKRAQAVLAAYVARVVKAGGMAFGVSTHAGLAAIGFGGELSMTFESGAAAVPAGERFLGQTIIPLLGNLVRARQPTFVRG